MAVSPADFELYSRVTGRAVPRSPQERMKMAPAVNKFIKNREYERPQQTTLQKGADLLGKAALIGGALAAGHAIGGGFRGTTAEKVAEVVGNMAKTGDVGEKGGKVVKNVAKAATGMAPLSNEVYGALQQEEILNNLAQDTVLPAKPEVSAQIESPRQKTEEFLDNLTNRRADAGGLSRMERLMNRERFGERADLMEDEVSDEYARRRRVEKGLEEPSPEEQFNLHTTGSYFDWEIGEPSANQARKAQKKLNMPELPPGMQNMVTTPNIDVLEADWKSGYPLEYDQTDPPSGGGGGSLVPVAPQPTEIVATTPESSEVVSNEGGLRQRVEDFGNRAEQHVKDWWHLDNEKMGYELQGALENENPLAGAAQAAGVIVPALAKQGLINTGQTAEALYGYGKSAYEKAQDIYLKSQIDRASMGVGGGKLVVPDFSVSDSPLLYGMQNQIDQGWSRHDAAIAPLAKNLQAAFGITLPTGQIAIGEGHQLNRHPDRPPGETDMAPSRNRAENDRRSDWENVSLNQYNKYASFKDKDISGEGSLTPGDRSDLQALLSGSSAALGPDETVGGDIEIRTDIGSDDPVLAKSLYGRRVGKGEKDKFIAGLKARNEDVYSGEGTSGMRRGPSSDYETHFGSDSHVYREDVANALRQKYKDGSLLRGYKKGQEVRLPVRKEGTGINFATGKRGTTTAVGELGSLSGAINFNSPDDRPTNVFQDVSRQFKDAFEEVDQAGWDVGERMAEREEQGSTEWVRSPDGKLRRKKIDDPWES